MEKLNWEELELNKIYKYEEKHFFQAVVKILNKEIVDNYISIDLEILELVYGETDNNFIRVSKTLDPKYKYLVEAWFLDKEADFEYFIG